MAKTDYYVLTQILIDDLHFNDGRCHPDTLGGGCYTIAGMRIWTDHVGICSGIGTDFKGNYDKWFLDNDIDVVGIPRNAKCTHSRLTYFADGEREEILLPGYGSHALMQPAPTEIPAAYDSCKGMYLFKDCQAAFWDEMIVYLRAHPNMVSVWEILGSAATPENREKIAAYLKEVDIFSLNMTEGKRLTGKTEPMDVLSGLLELNPKVVLLRMGEKGSMVSDGKHTYKVPTAPTNVVDVTGGGNSSTGGFLVGYCESGGDIEQAGRWAAAAASLVIAQYGLPLVMDDAMRREAQKRAAALDVTAL